MHVRWYGGRGHAAREEVRRREVSSREVVLVGRRLRNKEGGRERE